VDAQLDPSAILRSLGLASATVIGPVGGGSDTAIWRVQLAGEPFALRVFRAEQGPACRREVAALGAAHAAGLPVPRVETAGVWQDRPAMLISWLPGRTLAAELAARPWRVWPLALAFGRLQARIHACAAPAEMGEPPDCWLAWLGEDEPALRAWLHQQTPVARALLHFDYHPLNVMTDGRHITGVLDWTNASAGDPRADYARTSVILRVGPAMMPPTPGLRRAGEKLVLGLLARGWRRGYRQVAGRPTGLAPYRAWAGAVIARDLAPRPGRSGLPLPVLAELQRWTAEQKHRAGLPG
jgi:aminoglycoside phosphotransferase (APT) family kinase protein